jgi:hypothetical protein
MSAPRSDHLAVFMSICHNSVVKGNEYWKLNNSWLKNDDYICTLNKLIDDCIIDYNDILSPKHFWDLCKTKIRSFSIEFAKGSQKARNTEMKRVESELQKLYDKCINYPDYHEFKMQYHNCKVKYEILYNHYMKGLQNRSKEKWIEDGEKCSKYFLNLEKNRVSKKCINVLQCNDGNLTTDQSEILKEEVAYFSELYKSKIDVSENELDDFFSDTVLPSLSIDDRNNCEGILTGDECFDALSAMDNNKSPGYDGLTAEFYRHLWPKIGHIVVDALNDAFQTGSFTTCQNRGIISLIHKGKDLPRDSLNNYRPIALLNIDYKIATKALAARVQNILHTLIDSDQNGFIKGRNIQSNIRLIEDVLRFVDNENIPGIMICIDFKKAFDSIERDFIFYALKKLNFGPMFQKWVSVIFSNSTNCILNNGHISSPFSVDCGVRQGCPIASLIFVLSVELLACKIRQSNQIHGITLPLDSYDRTEVRISTFADDTTVFVKTPNCVKIVMSMFDNFTNLSGLAVNHSKSDALWIGSLKNNNYCVGNINWKLAPNNTIKILGVTFSPSTPIDNLACNWTNKMNKIECSIRAWKMRGLSMIGRNLVVKTLLASQFSYIASVINIPDTIITKLHTIFFKFIWNRGEAVKRNTVIADYDKGGINVFHVKLFFDSLKMSWVNKLNNSDIACWKNIPLYYINKLGMGMNVFNCNCKFKQINNQCYNTIKGFPYFYYKLFKIWFDTKHALNKEDISSRYNQVIWNNNAVQLNNKTLFFRDWIKSGIIFIRDLFNEDGSSYSLNDLQRCVIPNGATILEYYALRNALPNGWKIARTSNDHSDDDIDTNSLFFNSVSIESCTTKMYRQAMINNIYVPPVCANFWSLRFPNYIFDWTKIWLATPQCTVEARLISLNWKILHNIYPTKVLLCKMGKEPNNICHACNVVDNVDHFFFKCVKIKQLWPFANNVISCKLSNKIVLSIEDVMFNYHNNNFNKIDLNFINYVIAIGKLCVSKFRYGDHPNLLFLFERELRLRGLISS